jgi:hypothetical protein
MMKRLNIQKREHSPKTKAPPRKILAVLWFFVKTEAFRSKAYW